MNERKSGNSVNAKMGEQAELCRRHGRELEKLEKQQQDEARKFLEGQAEQIAQLKKRHVVELVDLWQRQGRQLGPWAEPVLAGELPRAFPRPGKVGHG